MDLGTIVGILIGLIGIVWGFFISKASTKKHLTKIGELNFQICEQGENIQALQISNQKKKEEIIKEFSFYPLRLENPNGAINNGLELFENKIVELVKDAKKNVKLCIVTPLLHSLRKEWKTYSDQSLNQHGNNHWACEFCEPFFDTVYNLKNKQDITIDIDVIFLEDNLLRKFVSFIPPKKIPWRDYESSIHYFFSRLKGETLPNKPELSNVNYYQIPESPLYFALIDTPDEIDTKDWEDCKGKGVMTFINCQDLIYQNLHERKSSEVISQDLEPFAFSNKNILKFFVRLFNNLSLQNHSYLYSFYKQMNTYGYDWGMVQSTTFEQIIEDIEKFDTDSLISQGAGELISSLKIVTDKIKNNKYYISRKDE